MRRSKWSRIAVLCVLAACLAFDARSARAAQINIFSGSLSVFADFKGFFKAEGLDVSVRTFSSGADATEGFRAGAAQFLVASDTPLLYLLPGGDVVLLAQFFQNEDVLLIVADKGVKGPGDLKGKKIGLVRKSASEFLLKNYLARGGLRLEDVKLVPLAPFDQVPALVRGDVDALSTWKPFDKKIFALSNDKFRTVSWNAKEDYLLYSGIAAKRSYVAANPGEVTAVLRALRKASAWLTSTDPKVSSKALGEYLKTSPEEVEYVLAKNTWKMVDDPPFRKVLHDIEGFLLAQNLISRKVNWAEAVDAKYLRTVDPALVKE
jgi:NitT/TauT family transport system substrate-binding protein